MRSISVLFDMAEKYAKWWLGAFIFTISLNAHATSRFSTMDVETVSGKLEGWVYAESADSVGDFSSKGEITLNKIQIGNVDQVNSIQPDWGYPQNQPYAILILSLQLPYPQECEANFVLIELNKVKPPVVTSRFGNCHARPIVRYKFGQVVAYFPEFGKRRKNNEIAFVYENGNLRQITVTAKIRSGTWTEPLNK